MMPGPAPTAAPATPHPRRMPAVFTPAMPAIPPIIAPCANGCKARRVAAPPWENQCGGDACTGWIRQKNMPTHGGHNRRGQRRPIRNTYHKRAHVLPREIGSEKKDDKTSARMDWVLRVWVHGNRLELVPPRPRRVGGLRPAGCQLPAPVICQQWDNRESASRGVRPVTVPAAPLRPA